MSALRRLIWWVLVLYGGTIGCALAEDILVHCDLSDRASAKFLTYDEFSTRLHLGAIAIAEGCDESTGLCERYASVSQCDNVRYSMPPDGTTSHIYFAINSAGHCNSVSKCVTRSSFVAASILFSADRVGRTFLDLVRYSADWQPMLSSKRAARPYDARLKTPDLIEQFVSMHRRADFAVIDLNKSMDIYWHSTYLVENRTLHTAVSRDFLGDALGECLRMGCAARAFLMRFDEDVPRSPAIPMLFGGDAQGFARLSVRTMAPDSGDAYEHRFTVLVQRPRDPRYQPWPQNERD